MVRRHDGWTTDDGYPPARRELERLGELPGGTAGAGPPLLVSDVIAPHHVSLQGPEACTKPEEWVGASARSASA